MGTGMDTDTEPNRDELRAGYVGQLVEALRVLVVGGMPAGVLVAGSAAAWPCWYCGSLRPTA
jgi:hypothetical protein